MKLFITSTNTDIGKTYVTKETFKLLQNKGYKVCIFKPFQTEEIEQGKYPDLEVFLNECNLEYQDTSLYTFKDPVSPHLAFKRETNKKLDKYKLRERINMLDLNFDFVLIEGAGGIAVPIYEENQNFYMTTDLIRETSDFIVSVLPSKLGSINDALTHQNYIDDHNLPHNLLVMNNYGDSPIERDNKETIEKIIKKKIYTFKENGNFNDFSDEYFKQLIGEAYEK